MIPMMWFRHQHVDIAGDNLGFAVSKQQFCGTVKTRNGAHFVNNDDGIDCSIHQGVKCVTIQKLILWASGEAVRIRRNRNNRRYSSGWF